MNAKGWCYFLVPVALMVAFIWSAIHLYPAWYSAAFVVAAIVTFIAWLVGFVFPVLGSLNSDV